MHSMMTYASLIMWLLPLQGVGMRSQNMRLAEGDSLRGNKYFVILAIYPIGSTLLGPGKHAFSHSEVLWCEAGSFPASRADLLREMIAKDLGAEERPYTKIPTDWWKDQPWAKGITCDVLTFGKKGDAAHNVSCSGVKTRSVPFADHVRGKKSGMEKYIYGISDFSLEAARTDMCRCGTDWTRNSYSLFTHNCNTFSASVMKCALGLSDQQPLGWSSMSPSKCCDDSTSWLFAPT
ncbi:unnamed protein product [Prorocentrum cordatum]|uniref:PPPDE domain-containing protein n=1 Tax=Prorocentrum cordatum TaxID=2364126 RepID=A0ABN9V9Y6_9DINO|nr:unnamed protein product [Polarella glacialis]|mmetsp:Transcript_50831/g.135009  ORF Transcript_50831/g.135009 Transcript_50831/m.135009 type:complete len:235 (+) Transcript_50831:68-772(+)